MANLLEMTPELIKAHEEWVKGRPQKILDVVEKYPPWKLYRLKETGDRVQIYSYSEPVDDNDPVTLQVAITGQFNLILFGRLVFGVPPEDLEECDLPGPDELVGDISQQAGYSQEDVMNILIPKIKELGIFDGPCSCDGPCAAKEPTNAESVPN